MSDTNPDHEREIAGLTVHARMLPPMKAYRLFAKLGKIAVPISRALQPGALEKLKAGDYSLALPLALSVFVDLKEDDAESLALSVLAGTSVKLTDGDRPRLLHITTANDVNAAFAGNLKAMLGAMLFALEINYKDFFSGVGQSVPKIPTP